MNSSLIKLLLVSIFMIGGSFAITGCEEDGPIENAGEEVQEAGENAGEEMQEAGEEMKDEADDAT